jgi:translation elongation factor EF-4
VNISPALRKDVGEVLRRGDISRKKNYSQSKLKGKKRMKLDLNRGCKFSRSDFMVLRLGQDKG